MGVRLMKYYQYISETTGLEGKRLLAQETRIPSVIAATAPDSEENLKRFKDAVRKITSKPPPEF